MGSKEKRKAEVLIAMNNLVKAMNNEEAYYAWINVIPDQCDDSELVDIASHNDTTIYDEAVKLFMEITSYYLYDGLYIAGKAYYLDY